MNLALAEKAHCGSVWRRNFRTFYLQLLRNLRLL
jgi:hypothetical protein